MVRPYLDGEIGECVLRLRKLDIQLRIDRGYVESPDADPDDLPYIKCQVALGTLEKEYIERRLALLRKLFSATSEAA